MPQTWRFDLGATTHPGQIASIRVLAPRAHQVSLRLGLDISREVALTRTSGGFHESVVMKVQFGTRYAYVVDGGAAHPDPASRGQAEGPLGPSQVVETLPDRWLDPAHLLYARALRASTVHEGDPLWALGRTPTADELAAHLESRPWEAIRFESVCEPSSSRPLPAALFALARVPGGARALHALVKAAHQSGFAVIMRLPFDRLGPECGFLLDFGPWVERARRGRLLPARPRHAPGAEPGRGRHARLVGRVPRGPPRAPSRRRLARPSRVRRRGDPAGHGPGPRRAAGPAGAAGLRPVPRRGRGGGHHVGNGATP